MYCANLIVIVETTEDEESGGWGLSISNEGGSEFINTGFIYADESYAIRKLCKVLGIINDLKMVYWSYQNESEEMAIWHLLDSFNNHCRAHMRSLQFYVHCLEAEQ